jgi:hypothetical protein
MNRVLAISLLGAALLTRSPTDAAARMTEAREEVVWLSCAHNIDGQEGQFNYIFAIDLGQKMVLQFDTKFNVFYEMDDISISQDDVRFSYYTGGSHPLEADKEIFHRIAKSHLNNPLEAYISTSLDIDRRSLSLRAIRRYRDTMLDHGDGSCSVMQPVAIPSRQF